MRKYIFLAGALALLLAGCGTSAPDQTEALTSIAAYPETMHLTVGSHEGIQVVLSPSDASEQELPAAIKLWPRWMRQEWSPLCPREPAR